MQRAEVSNYEIVSHYFAKAAERLGLREDIAAVMRSPYREVQVQIPVKLKDGKIRVFSGFPRPAQRSARPVTTAAC